MILAKWSTADRNRPQGEHRYFFKAFALDTVLPLGRGVRRDVLEREMQDHILESATLMGKYAR
jgi:phosphatidylethanolamine-binding protein (PEBP) family uncharacterized protein